jgi:DNA-binding LytR/AlgR family response regulator
MRALIAEDEPHLADDLTRRLTRLWPALEIVNVVHDGLAARRSLIELAPDIAFLDIRMPGLSGLEAAKSAPTGCRVVFVTAHDEHAVTAFEQAAADYLLKPVSDARLEKCISRLQQTMQQAMPAQTDALLTQLQGLLGASGKPEPLRWLRAQVGQDVRLIAVDDVCFFQATDKYTSAVTRDGEFLLRTPLKELTTQLDPALFWQVHRGTLVNVHQIKAAKRDLLGRLSLTLRDRPETLAVSRSYAHLFRQM